MRKPNMLLALAVISSAAFLSACGSNNSDLVLAGNPSPQTVDPSIQPGQSVQKTLDYIIGLIANSSENSDPVDINDITLAVDDTAEPTAL